MRAARHRTATALVLSRRRRRRRLVLLWLLGDNVPRRHFPATMSPRPFDHRCTPPSYLFTSMLFNQPGDIAHLKFSKWPPSAILDLSEIENSAVRSADLENPT